MAFDFLKIGSAQSVRAQGLNPNGVTAPHVAVTDHEQGLKVTVQGNQITLQGRTMLMGSENGPDSPPITFSVRRPDGQSVSGKLFYPYNAGPDDIAQKMIAALPLGYEIANRKDQVSGGQVTSSTFSIAFKRPSRAKLNSEIGKTEQEISRLSTQVSAAKTNVGWATRRYANDVNRGAGAWVADKSLHKVYSADSKLEQASGELAIAQTRLKRLKDALPGAE